MSEYGSRAAHDDGPFVSIIVLNYNRLDALERSLASVVRQTYRRREIIVVDNHSDEDVRKVTDRFANQLRLVQLDSNLGACGGRNCGIQAARGDIIVTIDNDVVFMSDFELERIVDTFTARPQYQVLAFRICDINSGQMRVREWCHPRDWRTYADVEFETNYFCEGMCAYRRQVFDAVGMYYEPLFVYCEGWDLGLRILNAGFRILYAPQIRVAHLMAGGSRLKASTFYLFTRNYCWIAYRNYPVFAGIGFLAPKLAMMLFFALRDGHLKSVAKGLRDGLHVYFQHGMPRIPISGDTVRYLRELERQRPNLLIRYARHRAATQL